MKPTRKPCARCQRQLATKGNRFCEPCERIVRDEMKQRNYLENRHIRAANVETGKQPTGAR